MIISFPQTKVLTSVTLPGSSCTRANVKAISASVAELNHL